SRLVQTAREWPLIVAVGPAAEPARIVALEAAGCEVWRATGADPGDRLEALLRELGARRLTNLLVEGGAEVFRTLFARGLVDEIWAFTAAKVFGAQAAVASLPEPPPLEVEELLHPGGDLFVRGLVRR
ncbi:MAG: dihydrofolate reductase family protein, partial [Pirellulales bacterium]